MTNSNSYKSLININNREFENKNKTIIYLTPLIYYVGIMFLATFLYVMQIISSNIYIYILVFGCVLYIMRVIYILYTHRSFTQKTRQWTKETLSKRLRDVIPEQYFKCPRECQAK